MALSLLLLSCAKERGGDVSAVTDEPVPILFQTSMNIRQEERDSPKSVIDTWSGQELMVFGIYRRNGVLDLGRSGRFIDGAKTQAPSAGSAGYISLTNELTDNSYFYPSQGTLDFFSCCLAGASYPSDLYETYSESGHSLHRIAEKYINSQDMTLAFKITVDGTQDVMAAYADREADSRRSEVISPDEAYSSHSARENVYPTLHFSHVLSRLSIKAKAVSPGLWVRNVSVSARNTARLVAVRPNPGSTPSLEIDPEDAPGPLKVESPVPFAQSALPTDDFRDLGDCMIVPGDTQCVVFFTLKQEGKEGEDTTNVTVDMSKYGLVFKPGMWYDIKLSIFGPQSVEPVTAEMYPWVSGYGAFDINSDI
ncbi:MAG: fimbrillin family protein [Bacteroidales bacterium]|nr:fimbrillin family protein [Bacteroidales bacterium]